MIFIAHEVVAILEKLWTSTSPQHITKNAISHAGGSNLLRLPHKLELLDNIDGGIQVQDDAGGAHAPRRLPRVHLLHRQHPWHSRRASCPQESAAVSLSKRLGSQCAPWDAHATLPRPLGRPNTRFTVYESRHAY
jgi:hypothetical protein